MSSSFCTKQRGEYMKKGKPLETVERKARELQRRSRQARPAAIYSDLKFEEKENGTWQRT